MNISYFLSAGGSGKGKQGETWETEVLEKDYSAISRKI